MEKWKRKTMEKNSRLFKEDLELYIIGDFGESNLILPNEVGRHIAGLKSIRGGSSSK